MSNLDSRLIFSCPYCQHEIVVEGQNDYSHFLGCLFTCSQCGKTWKFGDTDIVDVLRNRQVIEKHNHKIINFLIELICLCNFLIAADYFIHKSFQQGVFFISLMTILLILNRLVFIKKDD